MPGSPAIEKFLTAIETPTIGDADDHIVADTVFCGGRWPASLLAEMEAADA